MERERERERGGGQEKERRKQSQKPDLHKLARSQPIHKLNIDILSYDKVPE